MSLLLFGNSRLLQEYSCIVRSCFATSQRKFWTLLPTIRCLNSFRVLNIIAELKNFLANSRASSVFEIHGLDKLGNPQVNRVSLHQSLATIKFHSLLLYRNPIKSRPVVQPGVVKWAGPLFLVKSFKKFNPKMFGFKRVLDVTCKILSEALRYCTIYCLFELIYLFTIYLIRELAPKP